MIDSLYDAFKKWSEKGSVYLISDPHLDDPDTTIMASWWPSTESYMAELKQKVHKNDTLICLGDVGNPHFFGEIKAHKVLIMGNHDESRTKFEPYFDEIYTGALIVGEKIILSHEPVLGLDFMVNIHGHVHDRKGGAWYDEMGAKHYNICSNRIQFRILSLKELIKEGLCSGIKDIHRATIDKAIRRKHHGNGRKN